MCILYKTNVLSSPSKPLAEMIAIIKSTYAFTNLRLKCLTLSGFIKLELTFESPQISTKPVKLKPVTLTRMSFAKSKLLHAYGIWPV